MYVCHTSDILKDANDARLAYLHKHTVVPIALYLNDLFIRPGPGAPAIYLPRDFSVSISLSTIATSTTGKRVVKICRTSLEPYTRFYTH